MLQWAPITRGVPQDVLSRLWKRRRPRRRRLGCFEQLESRVVLSTAGPIADRPYIDLGTSDNVAWDQPRVTVEFLTDAAGSGSVGPAVFNSWLLDTGANSVMAFASAVSDMKEPPNVYRTEGTFEELGVGGTHLFDISAAYRWDFAGKSGNRNTLLNTRILSDENTELSILGPRGIVGMPAMADRVTTWDYSVWTNADLGDLFMGVDFGNTLPPDNGHRLSVTVDNRVEFSPDAYVRSGGNPPVWADIPFMTGQLKHNGLVAEGNLLLDSGAQISVMSSKLATELGLDSNHDGALNERDANFARFETVGGVGGTKTAPVFLFDEVHLPTQQGPDLVWTELQWLVLDIIEGIDGVFGFDNMTSGWIEAFPVNGKSGYFMKNHLDFRNWNATGKGTVHFDLNPEVHQVIDPLGPGAKVVEPGRWTSVSEIGVQDTYEIALTQPPQSDVRIQLTNSEGQLTAVADADPSRDYLIFTPQNWNVPQTVRVRAVDDGQAENFHRSSIRHVSSSNDPAYAGVGMPRVIVNIIDNDFPGMMIIPSGGATEVAESGASDTYQVVLTMAPQQNVDIVLENVGGQVLVRGQLSGTSTLVFTPQNWNVPQTVIVNAVDDQVLEGDHSTYINHRISTSDSQYAEAFPLQEFVTIAENDFADFGDAPDPYPTLLGRNGARHLALGPMLGTARDHEADGQPHAAAAGDDGHGGQDDEDGVSLPASVQPEQSVPINVHASAAGFLNGWIDFNADGDWTDAADHVFSNVAVVAGNNALSFSVPSSATVTERTYARFRLSSQQGLLPTGLAPDGEVEDYLLAIRQSNATVPAGFTETLVASGISAATAMEIAPDGKLFVLEQDGTMEVWQNGSQLRANFFANTPLVVDSSGERGLLGIAFDPNYASNRYVYVYYTATTPTVHNRVSRFTANASGDLALAGSELVVIDLEPLGPTNHNGGAIHFGRDGKLYIAVGENAIPSNSQSLSNRLGKILRINSDGTIPADNPTSFQGVAGTTAGDNRSIWAIGLRNPYTSAFEAGTGRFFINDVGSGGPGRREEINDGGAGLNYGWPAVEGIASNPAFTDPRLAYGASTPGYGGNCAITGGTFYNPAIDRFSSSTDVTDPGHYLGDYFFSDLCGGFIKRFDPAVGTVQDFATGVSFPVDLKTTADGSLLYLERGTGEVWRIDRAAVAAPPRVEGVYVRGQAWDASFLNHLDASGLGHPQIAQLGYGPRVGSAAQLAPLPWNNVNQVTIVFDRDVRVAADDLQVIGVNQTAYTTTSFAYNAANRAATWTFTGSLPLDKLLLVLDGNAASGVVGSGGLALDGEWDNPTDRSDAVSDTYPSGNGTAGGNFHFRFNVLPGDINQSGGASIMDIAPLRDGLGSVAGAANYSYLADANGSGGITIMDIPALRDHLGRALPPDEPQVPAAGGTGGAGVAMLVVGGFDTSRLTRLAALPGEVCYPLVKFQDSSGQWRYHELRPQFSLAGAALRVPDLQTLPARLRTPLATSETIEAVPEQPSLVIQRVIRLSAPEPSSPAQRAPVELSVSASRTANELVDSAALPASDTASSSADSALLISRPREEKELAAQDVAPLIDESLLEDLAQDQIR